MFNRQQSSRAPRIPFRSLSAVCVLSCASMLAPSALAQDRSSRMIEEVIVSAQKRDEAVQDVPISMSVMDANFMVEQGITDLREALLYVPNVQVENAGFFAAPRARGFTFNNNNKAFEPPLGLAIDGVPYTRIPYFLAATFDLSRIEVLRGPQGTTFGKNTTAGLIHMITADPSEEWIASLGLQGGELERERAEVMVSGPIVSEKVLFRLSAFQDQRDGFTENTTDDVNPKAQESFRGHDRHGIRAKLLFPDLFGTRLKLSYEDVQLDDLGTGFELIRASADVQAFLKEYDPNTDFIQGNHTASLDDQDGRQVSLKTWNAEWTIDMGEWSLVNVAGHSVLDQYLTLDTDFTPAPGTYGIGSDRSPTITFESRVISPRLEGLFGIDELFGWDLGSTDLIFGAFYQNRKINDSQFRFIFDMPSYLGIILAASGDSDPEAVSLYSLLPNGGEDDYVEDFTQNYEQKAESLAFFGEFKWNFMPDWTFQLGMRNGEETKEAKWRQVYNQAQPAVVLPQAGVVPFEAEREIKDNQFQYKVSLNWQPTDNISLFLHRAEAVKGGGYNAFAFRDVEDELVFAPEYTTEWSLNAKTFWFDNTLAANISFFRMDVSDFQVLTRDPSRTTIGIGVTLVENAAEARSQGVEADVQWRAKDWLTLIATIGYNDTEYLDFENNECPADRPQEGGCDVSGSQFPFAPKWNNTLTALVRRPIASSGMEFTASFTMEQFSDQFIDVDLDERKVQEGFERYKASIGIDHPEQGWSFKVVGENLTNQHSGIRQGDLFAGVFVEIAEQPRLAYAQFNWQF